METFLIPSDPTTWRIFEWTFRDISLDECVVTITCDKSFNIHLITGKLIDSTNIDVSCEKMKNYPPILHGQLIGEARDMSIEYDNENSTVRIHIFKKEKKEWALCIVKQCELDNMIDPNSALILAEIILSSENSTEHGNEIARSYLAYCLTVNFPMAIYQQALQRMNQGDDMTAFHILSKLMQDFSYPPAYFLLGATLVSVQDNEKVDTGIGYLKKASELGSVDANLFLGKVYTPFNQDKYPQKDAKQALSYFEKATTSESPNPHALYEMARIYKKGFDGVPKDEEKANTLYQEAKALDKDGSLPELEEKGSKSKVLGTAITVGAFAIFATAIFLHFKRRK